jgi:hypothetical protein
VIGLVRVAALALLQTWLADHVQTSNRHIILTAACLWFAAVTTLAAIGCGVTALWLAVAADLGPVFAALIAGSVLLLASLSALLVAWGSRKIARHQPTKPTVSSAKELEQVVALAGLLLPKEKTTLLTVAAILGLVMARAQRQRV